MEPGGHPKPTGLERPRPVPHRASHRRGDPNRRRRVGRVLGPAWLGPRQRYEPGRKKSPWLPWPGRRSFLNPALRQSQRSSRWSASLLAKAATSSPELLWHRTCYASPAEPDRGVGAGPLRWRGGLQPLSSSLFGLLNRSLLHCSSISALIPGARTLRAARLADLGKHPRQGEREWQRSGLSVTPVSSPTLSRRSRTLSDSSRGLN
jgi:hypothetical protein